MAEELRKKRSPNFTNDEVALLLDIISRYKHILESKKMDSCTWKEKDLAWQDITRIFNEECPTSISRTKESLRKCYENKKKIESRNSKAEENIQIIIDGNDLNFADDKVEVFSPECELVTCNISEDIEINNASNTDIIQPHWGNYKPSHMKTPLHRNLKNMNKQVTNRLQASRRRPITTSHSTNLSKQYTELSDVKLELAKLQLEILKTDTEKRREREDEEHKLKIELLQLEIDIKQAMLRKLQ